MTSESDWQAFKNGKHLVNPLNAPNSTCRVPYVAEYEVDIVHCEEQAERRKEEAARKSGKQDK
ncbi:hypothetical protein E8E11_000815 [Didymella keratinophila]|nr:hypothetical protein E8E11_000815 [Didymella keratinophila]